MINTPISGASPDVMPLMTGIGIVVFGAAITVYLKKIKSKLRGTILKGTE